MLPKISPEDDFMLERWVWAALLGPVDGLMDADIPVKLGSCFQDLL